MATFTRRRAAWASPIGDRMVYRAGVIGLAVVVLGGCAQEAPPGRDRPLESPAKTTSWTHPNSVPRIQRAVSRLEERVEVPVVLPRLLPEGISLSPSEPVRFSEGGGGILHLVFDRKRHLFIQYGEARFDGCGGDAAKLVRVRGQPGLLYVSPIGKWSELIWPAKPGSPHGRYGLSGSLSAAHVMTVARSMRPSPERAESADPTGC